MIGYVESRRNTVRVLVLLAGAGTILGTAARGQNAMAVSEKTGATISQYDVVSIHPSKSDEGMQWQQKPAGISATNTTISQLVFNAYGIRIPKQVSGLPAWAYSTRYTIDAKLDADAQAVLQRLPRMEQWKQNQSMLQALLADRFQLRAHHESRDLPVYTLVVAKGGCKLKESQAPENESGGTVGSNYLSLRATSITNFVFSLGNEEEVERFIVDKTGLTGRYDINLKWAAPDTQREGADAGPSIFTALQEQLGLQLIPTRGPVDTIVIDHIEKPSAN
jgi:uncharacterized protein (TIGR03435 family)